MVDADPPAGVGVSTLVAESLRAYLIREHGLGWRERAAIHRAALRRQLSCPVDAGLTVAMLVVCGLSTTFLADWLRDRWGLFDWEPYAATIAFVWAVIGAWTIVETWRSPLFVYRALRARGHDVCVRCGYKADSAGGPCPECGDG